MIEFKYRNYFSVLNTKVKFVQEVKKEYGKNLAPEFNSLSFWKIDENKVSQILLYFLNPNEGYGQGSLYLNLFLKKFKINFDFEKSEEIIAIPEKITHNKRRIDIFISNQDSSSVIGIENKIYTWTKDQFNQLNDYFYYLKSISNNKNFTLIYLAPRDKLVPSDSLDIDILTQSEHREKFITLNYEDDLIPLLHEFAINSENERVRSFLLDFERKLKDMYMISNDINEQDILKKIILENKENFETSFKIASNIPLIKIELKEKLYKQLVEIANYFNLEINEDRNRISLPSLPGLKFGISYEAGGILYGLVRDEADNNKKRYPQIDNLFEINFNVSEWWAMWRFAYEKIEINSNFWLSIMDESFKKLIMEFISTILYSNISLDYVDLDH